MTNAAWVAPASGCTFCKAPQQDSPTRGDPRMMRTLSSWAAGSANKKRRGVVTSYSQFKVLQLTRCLFSKGHAQDLVNNLVAFFPEVMPRTSFRMCSGLFCRSCPGPSSECAAAFFFAGLAQDLLLSDKTSLSLTSSRTNAISLMSFRTDLHKKLLWCTLRFGLRLFLAQKTEKYTIFVKRICFTQKIQWWT